jgi:NitT/TauT family transport system permease protein
MKILSNTVELFVPFKKMNQRTILLMVFLQLSLILVVWQLLGNDLIPSPSDICLKLIEILASADFYFNFIASISLTVQGMGISIFIALLISYLSLIPFFNPLAKFIIKCRYLTLTGLIFLFTLLTKDGHQLKISLLIFGIVPFFVTSFLSVISSINVEEYELCKTLRMNSWKTLLEVVIIGRLDQVIEVLRQNFAIAWMMITMVEGLSMSEGGLGAMLIKSNKYIQLDVVFALLFVVLMIGILLDFALAKLRFWIFPYTKLKMLK